MKIRQAVLPVVLLGILFVTGCDLRRPSSQEGGRAEVAQAVEVAAGVEQVVIFYKENDEAELQRDVNLWLSQNSGKAEIVRVLQSQSGNYYRLTTITIFYKKMR